MVEGSWIRRSTGCHWLCQCRSVDARGPRPFRACHPIRATNERAGLAPLELILALPLLLMMLAMFIIIGTAGSWKVRTHANSRQAAARSLWPRDAGSDPKPDSWWPGSATMGFATANPSPFGSDPFAAHPVVRGPQIGAPGATQSLIVRLDTLDMTQELVAGEASINRELPMWKQLPWQNSYTRDNQVFSGEQWQHGSMQIPNNYRRVLATYEYDLGRFNPALQNQMQTAANALTSNPERPAMGILDRDDEVRDWGSWGAGDPYTAYSDDRYDQFSAYPAASVGCDEDLRPRVDALVARIHRVPCTLSDIFIRMYQQQIASLPPDDPMIPVLQGYIDQLNAFKGSVPCGMP